jgi:quercetin dioxygenase-like cupin family protein
MDRARFEAELQREGYALMETELGPDFDSRAHVHDFDVRFLVLDGAFTVTVGDDASTYRAGQQCLVPAGVSHIERTGPDGARFSVGTRQR